MAPANMSSLGAIIWALGTAKTPAAAQRGINLMILGLALQIACFGIYFASLCVFDSRISRKPTRKSRHLKRRTYWKVHFMNLYIASFFVEVRCIYRLVEFAWGNGGYLANNEWCGYAFDAVMMLILMCIFASGHPSEICAWLKGDGLLVHRWFMLERADMRGALVDLQMDDNVGRRQAAEDEQFATITIGQVGKGAASATSTVRQV